VNGQRELSPRLGAHHSQRVSVHERSMTRDRTLINRASCFPARLSMALGYGSVRTHRVLRRGAHVPFSLDLWAGWQSQSGAANIAASTAP
jgi:hypothetical protein